VTGASFLALLWLMLRPCSVSAVSPDRTVTARATSPGLLVNLVSGFAGRRLTTPLARYRVQLIDNHTGERATLIDEEESEDWFEDWADAHQVVWDADSQRVVCLFQAGLVPLEYGFKIRRRPLAGTPVARRRRFSGPRL
jgi:hypothetical protein